MRRIVPIFVLVTMLLTLTACEIHWHDKSYDVPWYMIAIPVALFSVIMFAIAGAVISKKKYVCPSCRHSFHPPFWVAMVSLHIGSDRYFKCPRCGKKSFCPLSRQQGDD